MSAGTDLRDDGAQRVLDYPSLFPELALSFLDSFSFHRDAGGGDFLAEEVRLAYEAAGYPAPHHANAWGAIFLTAAKKGLIERSGTMRQSTDPKAHARLQPCWRRKK